VETGDWELGTGNWGLRTGDSLSRSPTPPLPYSPVPYGIIDKGRTAKLAFFDNSNYNASKCLPNGCGGVKLLNSKDKDLYPYLIE